jgi:hypothetical protein
VVVGTVVVCLCGLFVHLFVVLHAGYCSAVCSLLFGLLFVVCSFAHCVWSVTNEKNPVVIPRGVVV